MQIGVALQQKIINSLKTRLEKDAGFDLSVLSDVVSDAILEVKEIRKYPQSYTEEQITEDLCKYEAKIKKIALYDYNKQGAEGQISHSENSVSRGYEDRDKLFNGILPLARL